MDISGLECGIHVRSGANNLVTTASTTHLPDQKVTFHMIQALRKETCSGGIDDLAHARSEDYLSECLTKHTARPDNLIKSAGTAVLPNVDVHPSFRSLLKHKAYLSDWSREHFHVPHEQAFLLLGEIVSGIRHVQTDAWTIHDDGIIGTHNVRTPV